MSVKDCMTYRLLRLVTPDEERQAYILQLIVLRGEGKHCTISNMGIGEIRCRSSDTQAMGCGEFNLFRSCTLDGLLGSFERNERDLSTEDSSSCRGQEALPLRPTL
ncbi:hypothetical protein KEM48_006215 [Puccinia striiformis f. sp. tritici PST-130]|nr:hypothetical protein H4Q26_006225 [Puccinia striiformis f. sp. tritici PST-130]KAI9619629.1 hypothetical protein KEM48_006215 [Puccinia striiformis f. sp. tritici PST-130]